MIKRTINKQQKIKHGEAPINFPCTHPQPDDFTNCLYYENYSFRKYIRYKISKSNREHKGE